MVLLLLFIELSNDFTGSTPHFHQLRFCTAVTLEVG